MSNLTQELAKEVVAAFVAEVDPATERRLKEPEIELLEVLVREALSAAIHEAAERVETLARELRSESGSPEIEL